LRTLQSGPKYGSDHISVVLIGGSLFYSGTSKPICREVVLFQRLFCTECVCIVFLGYPLLGDLSSVGGFTGRDTIEVQWAIVHLNLNYLNP
jgi:hypothetical protein